MSKSLETKQSVLKPSSVEFDLVLVMRISILFLVLSDYGYFVYNIKEDYYLYNYGNIE